MLHTFSTDSTAGNPSQTNLDIDNLQMEEEKTSNKTLSDLVKYSMHEALRGLSATAELLVERSYIPLYMCEYHFKTLTERSANVIRHFTPLLLTYLLQIHLLF